VMIVKEDAGGVTARIYPKNTTGDGELARAVSEIAVAQRWHLEELHTEEGRLDEVFRNITLPETAAAASKEETK
jgi:ABC-2 type transport system ATP-binding protein